MATFDWKPAQGASASVKPRVEVAKYGDGYEQRVGTSINGPERKWSLKFTSEVPAVLDFLEARGGHESFDWTDPLGRTGKFVCREWSPSHVGAELFSVSCDFEQVPE